MQEQAQEQAAHDLHERDNRVEQERQFTNDYVTRLEENFRTWDADILSHSVCT